MPPELCSVSKSSSTNSMVVPPPRALSSEFQQGDEERGRAVSQTGAPAPRRLASPCQKSAEHPQVVQQALAGSDVGAQLLELEGNELEGLAAPR
jgi:hypothetical protein